MEMTARDKLLLALEMADAGIAMKESQLRRQHPEASPQEIAVMLREWLINRPPDAPGRVRRVESP